MKRFLTKIIIAVLLVVLLPIAFLILRQLNDLTENEELVQNAFDQQLETILFTINQNSENYLNGWVNKLDIPVELTSVIIESVTGSIFENNPAVFAISFWDTEANEFTSVYKKPYEDFSFVPPDSILIQKLQLYLTNNYQRLETVRNNEFTVINFAMNSFDGKVIGLIAFHTKTFIDLNLRPGIEQITQNNFVVSIEDTLNVEKIVFNDTISNDVLTVHHQNMFYLPDYKMSIGLQNSTVEQLVQKRTKRENYIFIGMLIVVFIGVTFVIFSIRKEVHLAEMKSEFVSNVSHEIRTPLALISMYSETLLLNRIKDPDKKTKYLEVIHFETNRLTEIVNRILTFSKIEKKKKRYQFQPASINEIIKAVTKNYQPHFENKGVKCTCDLQEGIGSVLLDEDAMFEALINLIENAIKYNDKEDKLVVIRTVQSEDEVLIDVVDNGIGILPKHKQKIFDKFYRVSHGDLANKVKGTGIGLNIVKEIVENHKGKITVSSKLSEGSTFRIALPKS